MEFLEYLILVLIVVILSVGVIMVLLTRYNLLRPKTENENALEQLKHVHIEEIKSITDTSNVSIANLQKEKATLVTQKARIQEKLNKLEIQKQEEIETEEGSVENLQQNYEINPVKAVELVKSLGMNPEALTNPALAPLVWEKLNENKDLAIVMGLIYPKGQPPGKQSSLISSETNSETPETEKIDPIDELFKKLEEQGKVF